MAQFLQYLPIVMAALNVAGAAFLAGLPAGTPLPWWVLPLAGALNAVAHMVPSPTTVPPANAPPAGPKP